MRCPKCKHYVELAARGVRGTELQLEQCPDCKGLWFDCNELHTVLKLPERNIHFPDNAREGRTLCPRCKVPLHIFCYPQTTVIIDACKECSGVWLDDKEIRELSAVRESLEKVATETDGTKEVFKCPKCGYAQKESEECTNCGIIFSKYNRTSQLKPKPPPTPKRKNTPEPSGMKGQLIDVVNSTIENLVTQIKRK